jgi:succinate dehydrogenase/fumarate reductase iron-sulfur protein
MSTSRLKRTIRVQIARQDPNVDPKPRYEIYAVDCDDYTTVLDLLDQVREDHDSSLAYRYACRIGKCGICTARVDGKNSLTCMKRVGDVEEVVIQPPARQEVLRDLIVKRRG